MQSSTHDAESRQRSRGSGWHHQGGMSSWMEAAYSCSASWCHIAYSVTTRNRWFGTTATKTTSTRKHYHKEDLVWPQCHTLRFAQLRLVNEAQNAPWSRTGLGIVRIWHKIVGTDRCVCPHHPSQKGWLMVRLVSLAVLNVFTQGIKLVIAVLLLVLSIAVLQLMHLSLWIQNNYFVFFNNLHYLWTCLVWMWQNLQLVDYSCTSCLAHSYIVTATL